MLTEQREWSLLLRKQFADIWTGDWIVEQIFSELLHILSQYTVWNTNWMHSIFHCYKISVIYYCKPLISLSSLQWKETLKFQTQFWKHRIVSGWVANLNLPSGISSKLLCYCFSIFLSIRGLPCTLQLDELMLKQCNTLLTEELISMPKRRVE